MNMEHKFKKFYEQCLDIAKRYPERAFNMEAQCYGALMFYFQINGYDEKNILLN